MVSTSAPCCSHGELTSVLIMLAIMEKTIMCSLVMIVFIVFDAILVLARWMEYDACRLIAIRLYQMIAV